MEPTETDRAEVVATCERCDHLGDTRSRVILIAGVASVFTPGLIVVLSFWDALARHVAWNPDDRILLACLAGVGSIMAFAWRGRKE